MLPFFDLGFIKIPSYPLMLVLGVIAYAINLVLILKKEGKEPPVINKALTVSLFAFAVMGITAFIFDSIFHSIEVGYLVFGGITWAGGVVGSFPAFVILTHYFIKEERGSEIEFFSLVVPGIVLGHAFGRIGCFLGGCCFGGITESSLGVVFPTGSPAAQTYPNTITGEGSFPVLPTQLFEAGFELLLYLFMMIFRKKFKYNNAEIYLISYGIFRFMLEFLRGDSRGATCFFISPSQFLSIILIITGVLIILFKKRLVFTSLYDKLSLWREQVKNGVYNAPTNVESKNAEIYKEIELLHGLYQKGILTEEEYQSKKAELLNKI